MYSEAVGTTHCNQLQSNQTKTPQPMLHEDDLLESHAPPGVTESINKLLESDHGKYMNPAT